MENIIGKRIKIVGNHPHAGETGLISRAKKTALGKTGLVIKLENCEHGIDECFVFRADNIQMIK